jgi:hypothetical protein
MGILAVRTDRWRAADLHGIEESARVSVERIVLPGEKSR